MSIAEEVAWASVDELLLDPKNPRLGRNFTSDSPSPDRILKEIVSNWGVEELATSFISNGFWTQEAVVVVEEKLGRKKEKIVVEGNRRLAALKMLHYVWEGGDCPKKWIEIAGSATSTQRNRLKKIPYIVASNRKEVQAYLGFRHVTGIKEWNPAEKAEFIAHLVDDHKLTFREVMRKIGSKTPAVRQNYIAYRILRQMEDSGSNISIPHVEDRFSVLYLSLRTNGVQAYLNIDINADEKSAKKPIPKTHLQNLEKFALWLFGNEDAEPMVRDSRQIDRFGKILLSPQALQYLDRTEHPSFEVAYRYSGGDEVETVEHIERASDEIEQALGTIHIHRKSKRIQAAVERLGKHVYQLMTMFPEVKNELESGE